MVLRYWSLAVLLLEIALRTSSARSRKGAASSRRRSARPAAAALVQLFDVSFVQVFTVAAEDIRVGAPQQLQPLGVR
jgi:hypothetical protein